MQDPNRKNDHIRLSPSTLGLFMECPRCFWLHINEHLKRPQGPFPSLPGGMDIVIKGYFDQYRGALPPELEGKVEGVLLNDLDLLNKWRNWRTGLSWTDQESGAKLSGALDDCLRDAEYYIPLDYKTRGFAPKEGGEAFYQHQLDAYNLLLQENSYPIKDYAYLVYYYPREVRENGLVQFIVEPKKISTDIERVRKTFRDAVAALQGPMPKAHAGAEICSFCAWQDNNY